MGVSNGSQHRCNTQKCLSQNVTWKSLITAQLKRSRAEWCGYSAAVLHLSLVALQAESLPQYQNDSNLSLHL